MSIRTLIETIMGLTKSKMSLEEQKELFVEAIRNEDLKKLKQLIKNGFTIVNHINNKINRQFGDFTTPLHLAACRKN